MKTKTKAELRKQSRSQRRALSKPEQLNAAARLKDNFLSLDRSYQAEKIAIYLASDGEIDAEKIMHWCWENKKQVYAPIIGQKGNTTLLFALITPETQFKKNHFSIDEPITTPEKFITAESLDLVLMPLVAFDKAGNRLGMGGGYYDTTFSFVKNSVEKKDFLLGIAHDFQCVDDIQTESWDIPLDTIVTDKQVYCF